MRKFFGTDGIRGVAGKYPLDRFTTYCVGLALATWVREKEGSPELVMNDRPPEVVIGMDTRESGGWIAEHIAGGLAAQRIRPHFAGLITTPGLAHVTRTGPFAAGVMISASHNPYQDNGIKIIDHSGFKLPDEQEDILERDIEVYLSMASSAEPVPLAADDGLDREYIQHLAATMSRDLTGMKIVADGANGAASFLAPALFEKLGAQFTCINCAPDGRNINLNCGSLHLASLREAVLSTGADVGVAFDGDADRALFVSHSGKIIDGDAVMYLCALPLHEQGRLTEVVATVMSNLGLERALKQHGIGLVRTPVGDRYVLQEMQRRKAPLGGEQSGHVIFSDYATTGDGLLTALRVFEVMRESGANLDDLTAAVESYPQLLVNVKVARKRPLEELDRANREIRHAEAEFGDAGRVLVRFSGTEPLARVMVEGPELKRVEHFAHSIADAIRADLGE
jgi:phosphoglucosamine mutase